MTASSIIYDLDDDLDENNTNENILRAFTRIFEIEDAIEDIISRVAYYGEPVGAREPSFRCEFDAFIKGKSGVFLKTAHEFVLEFFVYLAERSSKYDAMTM